MSVARNTGCNVLASMTPVVVSLATIPTQLHYLGEARFGILAIFAILLGYFAIFDLGISRAIAQRMAAVRDGNSLERGKIFWTGLAVNLAMGGLAAVVVLPLATWFFGTQMKAPPALHSELVVAAGWLALAVPTSLLTQVLRGAMQAGERFATLNLIYAIGNVSSQLLPLAVAIWYSPSLTVVLPVLFMTRFASMLALIWAVLTQVLGGFAPTYDRERAKDLLSFGGWVAVSSFVTPLMTALDRVLIGSMISTSAVSHYTVPYQLGDRTLLLPGALTDAVFPRIAARDEDGARAMAIKALAVITAVITPIMVAGIIGLRIFLSLWISPEFAAQSATPGTILFAGFCFAAMGIAMHVRLQAGGKPRLVAIAHLIEVVPFLCVLWLGFHFLGLPGAAVASALRFIFDMLLLAWFAGLLKEAVKLALIPAALLGVALAIGPNVTLDQPAALAAGAAAIVMAGLFGLWRLAGMGLSPHGLIIARLKRRAQA